MVDGFRTRRWMRAPPASFTTPAAFGLLLVACSSTEPTGESQSTAKACGEVSVDVLKELAIVDEEVTNDPRANNAADGTWSFRHLIESIAPAGRPTSDFTQQWLRTWESSREVNGFPLDRQNEGREATMQSRILCPWLKRTPANACNDDCSRCDAQQLDLAQSPFRLMGVFNRIDIRETEVEKLAGEVRMPFALTDGPADDPASKPLAMTVIFEFNQPPTRSPSAWAAAWHALGAHPAFDASYRVELEALTEAVVERPLGASPDQLSIAHVRTNEAYLNWIWQQRQFSVDGSGALGLEPLHNTPPSQLNNSAVVKTWILANKDAILRDSHTLPVSLSGGASELFTDSWSFDGLDPALRKAFARNTCNGCHSQENPTVDTAFHVSPFKSGAARLSRYLYDPTRTAPDELGVRTLAFQRALCSN